MQPTETSGNQEKPTLSLHPSKVHRESEGLLLPGEVFTWRTRFYTGFMFNIT